MQYFYENKLIGKMEAMSSSLCLLALLVGCCLLVPPAGVYSLDVDRAVPLNTTTLRHYIVYKAADHHNHGDVTMNANDDMSTMSVEAEMQRLVNLAQLSNFSQANTSLITTFDVGDVAQPSTTVVEFTYVFQHALRGCALKLTEATAAALSTFPGVNVMLDDTIDPDTTHTPEFLGLASGQLWPRTSFGKDVIVGVIDTGVWPESGSFTDTGMGPVPTRWKGVCQEVSCNRKLIGARYFSKGHEAAEGVIPHEVLSPRDSNGHGTHTASTAAGATVTGGVWAVGKPIRGMASGARLAVYKVCWRSCYNSDVLAAYDQAVRDGVDVLSVSLGSGPQKEYEDEVNAVGSFGAMKAGIFVAQSAGNRGERTTVANVAPWVMTVGASTVDRDFYVSVKLGNGVVVKGVSWTPGAAETATPLVLASKVAAKGADPFQASNCVNGTLNPTLVKGNVVVCKNDRENNTTTVDKGVTVLDAGGAGVIILDDGETPPIPQNHVLPSAHVGKAAGATILSYMNSSSTTKPTVMLSAATVVGIKPAPLVASFSSRGPSMTNSRILKPDITAPGVSILAAWQGNDNFNIISGTSMACPHIAGLAVLLRGAHPTWSPAMIKSALMTTASVTDNREPKQGVMDQSTSRTATPFDFGAGHVTPELALNPGLVYDVTTSDYITYLCATGYSPAKVQIFTGDPVTCPKVLPRVEDFNYPTFTVTFIKGKPLAVCFTRTVTNVGDSETGTYDVLVNEPTGAKIVVSPRKLQFTSAVKSLKFSVRVTMAAPTEAFGRLTWTQGSIRVQSPIVITPV